MHPGIKVQFELDIKYGHDALSCKECPRPKVPDSKNLGHIPPKQHPPLACGLSIFGSSNSFEDVAELAERNSALLIILLRINHVSHAISSHRHFNKPARPAHQEFIFNPVLGAFEPHVLPNTIEQISWTSNDMIRLVEEQRQAYSRLLQFPSNTHRPAHLVFYEDMKRNPQQVWLGLQKFLNIPTVSVIGLESLEKKATNKPSIMYLKNLPLLQDKLQNQEWRDMLLEPEFDLLVNVTEAFQEACNLYPVAHLSWRMHTCSNGTLVAS